MNVLIFLVFDFVPALLIYCTFAAIIKIGYQKRKAQKKLQKEIEMFKKNQKED